MTTAPNTGVRFDGNFYAIEDKAELDRIFQQAATALKEGSGPVWFTTWQGQPVTLLVSRGTPITFVQHK